ncbi:peptidase [Aureococcus anophagefferens]|nr:peptidase [Aureococcus anophagefferens]
MATPPTSPRSPKVMTPRTARVTGKSALMREGLEKTTPKKAEIAGGQAVTVIAVGRAKDGTPRAKLAEPAGWANGAKANGAKPTNGAGIKWLEQPSFEMAGATMRSWVHARSGCRVRLASAAGPMANLYGCLATEAVDTDWALADDGLPHTLEHLVFLGSEDYPYKGVLDKLANRCLARGTNAWTDVDHTAYTVTTAGSSGLLNLLPIYVDHILRPTLTEAGFETEVHHVTGGGEDKGVVYCEMQGRETTAESLAERECLAALYPKCGYSSETGGLCANVRALKNGQVQRYHAEFYRASNLCLVVTGGVDADKLLATVDGARERSWPAAAAAKAADFPRPWTTPVAALDFGGDPPKRTCDFPAADESTGLVVLGWRATAYGEFLADAKASVLWQYLADGASSPLTKAFVDAGKCSGVWPTSDRFKVGYRQVWFEDVDVAELDAIPGALDAALAEEAAKGVDLARLRDVVARSRRRSVSALEDDPTGFLVSPALKHFIYAENREDTTSLKAMSDALGLLDACAAVGQAEWDAALRALADARDRVVVTAAVQRRQGARRRAARVLLAKTQLGDKGLKEKQAVLDAAVAENERPIPEAMLDCVPEPDLDEAVSQLFTVASAQQADHAGGGPCEPRAPAAAALAKATTAVAPPSESRGNARWTFDHVDGTQFCRVDAACDTSGLSPRLRSYLPLFSEVLFKAPVFGADGVRGTADANVEELRRTTVSYGAGVGHGGGGTAHLFFVGAKLSRELGFKAGADIVGRAMAQTDVLDDERLGAAVTKLGLELQGELRDGNAVSRMALRSLVFDAEAKNEGLLLAARQRAFLKRAKFALSTAGRLLGAEKAFKRDLVQLKEALFRPGRVRARVCGDLLGAAAGDPLAASDLAGFAAARRLRGAAAPRGPAGGPPTSRAAGRAGPARPRGRAAVALEYLNALEGDFWVKIRGAGLAYGASARGDASQGLVHFSLYRSADPVAALAAARTIVAAYASGETPFRPLDFTNARGSLASGLVESEKTRSAALAAAWRRALLNQDADRNRAYLRAVAAVTERSALDAIKAYVAPLFDDATAATAVACAPAKAAEMAATVVDAAKLVEPVAVYDDASLDKLVGVEPDPLLKPAKRAAVAVVAAAALAAVALLKAKKRA